jgi:hypothetical protein
MNSPIAVLLALKNAHDMVLFGCRDPGIAIALATENVSPFKGKVSEHMQFVPVKLVVQNLGFQSRVAHCGKTLVNGLAAANHVPVRWQDDGIATSERCLTPQTSDALMRETHNTFMVGERSLHLLVSR